MSSQQNSTIEFPKLESENLILRAASEIDVPNLFQVFADDEVMQYHDLEPPTQLKQVQGLIDRWSDRFTSSQGIRWGIARKIDNLLIGSCGYRYKSPFLAELGYELARPHWRQGIMTEALKAAIQYGFETKNLNRIEAMVMRGNIASTELLRKLGFVEEGILREYGYWKGQFHDLTVLSLLKREYQSYVY